MRNQFYINDDTLFAVSLDDKDAGKGRGVKYVIIPESELFHKNLQDFIAAVVPMITGRSGGIKVLMKDCTLRDITIILPTIWELRKKMGIDKD